MKRFDVVVIGGGAAGIGAALAARRTGKRVLLIDEAPALGGQLQWRMGPFALPDVTDKPISGPELAGRLAALPAMAGITIWTGTAAWALYPEVVAAISARGPVYAQTKAVVVASGSVDIGWPVPGWTLPGVITGTGLLKLVNLHRLLPGRRFAVIGASSLASESVDAIDASGGFVAWRGPFDASLRIEGDGGAERLIAGGQPQDIDAVVLAFGRRPDPGLVLEAQAAVHWERAIASPLPVLSATGESSLPGVFVAGDAARLHISPAAAFAHGAFVGAAAAGELTEDTPSEMTMDSVPDIDIAGLPNDLVVDRTEGVSLGDLRQAVAGAHGFDLDDVARMSRLGMGTCQGVYSLPAAATIVAELTGRTQPPFQVARRRSPARLLPVGSMVERWVATE